MDPFSLFSAGLSFLGGQMNRSSQDDFNRQQAAIAQQNIAQQREFAQHGIQWKVDDARAAGINPLAALGSQPASFSPVSIGGEAAKPGDSFTNMGQDLQRAFKAASTASMREESDNAELRKLNLEKASLENDVLRNEIASKQMRTSRINAQVGPPMPIARTISENAPVKADDIKQKAEDFPATKIGRPFGYPVPHNPWFGDGQSFEDRYGDSEIGSTLKGAANLLADHAYMGYKWGWPKIRDFYGKYGPRNVGP